MDSFPGVSLFEIEEALNVVLLFVNLLSDAAQIAMWPTVKIFDTGKGPVFLSWLWYYL